MSGIVRAVVVLGLIGGGVYLFTGADPSTTRSSAAQAPTAAPLPPAVSRPAAGVVTNRTGRRPEAPFEIVTSPGADYFLKLVEAGTGQDALTIYVRGGERLEVTVPLSVMPLTDPVPVTLVTVPEPPVLAIVKLG